MQVSRSAVLAIVLLGLCSCEKEQARDALRLVDIHPKASYLFLNERINLLFDRPVDPSTVTEDSIRIVDEAGLPVEGSFEAHKDMLQVSFRPRPPTDPELSNGSFRPGRRYHCELARYPLSNAIRGAGGELLLEARKASWTAVDPKQLPAGFYSCFLPGHRGQALQITRQPRLSKTRDRLWLSFSRPIYPPSLRRAALRLYRGHASTDELPLLGLRILPTHGPGGYGSEVEVALGRPLSSGVYVLRFPRGTQGFQDYALNALEAREAESDARWQLSGLSAALSFVVEEDEKVAPIEEDFHQALRGLREDPEELGLPAAIEAALQWGPDGLHIPVSAFRDFRSLGEFRATRNLVLKPGANVEDSIGVSHALPAADWDFDSFVIPKGRRVFLVLDRALRIRVRGQVRISGDLVVRVKGRNERLPALEVDAQGLASGDPRPRWRQQLPRLEMLVEGILRVDGVVAREGGGPRVGFVLGRGPLLLSKPVRERTALEFWRRPIAEFGPDPGASAARVRGPLAALSPWYSLGRGLDLRGALQLHFGRLGVGVRVLVQGHEGRASGRPTAWVSPERIPELGPLSELRFAVLVLSESAPSGLLLERLELR